MKYILAACILCFICIDVNSQEIIASSKYPYATANHNQRKIVRDSEENIFVVYADSLDNGLAIKGVYFDRFSEVWSSPVTLAEGNNPTLAINKNDKYS